MRIGTSQNAKDLTAKIQAVNEQILKIISRNDKIHNEQDLEKLECETQALTRELGDRVF